jgi:hypothetical protein
VRLALRHLQLLAGLLRTAAIGWEFLRGVGQDLAGQRPLATDQPGTRLHLGLLCHLESAETSWMIATTVVIKENSAVQCLKSVRLQPLACTQSLRGAFLAKVAS